MKTARIMSIVLFVAALAAFIFYELYNRKTADYSAPVITADSTSIVISVNANDEELKEGMSAIDNRDGDVTDTLVVASLSKFIKKNMRQATYVAFDHNNNVGRYTRELTYSDYVSPRFVLKRPLCFHMNDSYDNIEISSMIGAEDVLDGNISSQIIVTQGDRYTYDEDTERQVIDIQVSNRAGDTQSLKLELRYLSYTAYNRQCPNLEDYILYTTVGNMPDFHANIKGVRSGSNTVELDQTHYGLYSNFDIDMSDADLQTPGVYRVVYRLTSDETGEPIVLGSSELILIVEEE
ncbi:MAG: hypothetical protein IJL43_05955 [Lachnospiraceae bacterium]|nr:hypothetical protein [Lachnospiraceae bacterium]